jgi:hypothetical protein
MVPINKIKNLIWPVDEGGPSVLAYLYYRQINSSRLAAELARGGNYKRPYVERDAHKKVHSIYSGLMVQEGELNSPSAGGHVSVTWKFSMEGRNRIRATGAARFEWKNPFDEEVNLGN